MKILALIVALLLPTVAFGQTMSVNLNKAKLSWTWTPTVDSGPLDKFVMKCGSTSGNYNRLTDISPSLRSIAVKDVITGSGSYFCVIVSANSFGESGPSNELPFVAGVAPSGSIVLSIEN